MENERIILLKHHPMNVKFTNPFYLNQTDNKDLSEYIIIDVTSRIERNKEFIEKHPTFAKDLSPFYIGPVISADGVKANIFEIFWQCGKVYPCHNDNNKPNAEYFKWRNEFYSKEKCTKDLMRHTCKSIGYENKDALYFAYYNNEIKDWEALKYVEARKKIYFPEYVKLVYNTESFKWIKSLVDSGKKIALVDFDVINYYSKEAKTKAYISYLNECEKYKKVPSLTEKDFQRINSIKDLVSCPYLKVGHAVAIKALLENDLEVHDGKIKDNIGLLN